VSFESLYGIWSFDFLVVNALITLPKQDNDKLIFFAYYKVYPHAPDFLIF
jgi:hypothetical protein